MRKCSQSPSGITSSTTLHGNLTIYSCPTEDVREEDKDKRKREEETSGQNNYYVHCCLNVFWGGKMFSFHIFCVDVFLKLNVAQFSGSIVLMQTDGGTVDHQLEGCFTQHQPAQRHPVFNDIHSKEIQACINQAF